MGTLAFQGVWGVNRDKDADLMRIVLGSSSRLFAVVTRHRCCPNLRKVKARKTTGSGEQPIRARNKHLCVLEAGTVTTLNVSGGVPLRYAAGFAVLVSREEQGKMKGKQSLGSSYFGGVRVPFTMTACV